MSEGEAIEPGQLYRALLATSLYSQKGRLIVQEIGYVHIGNIVMVVSGIAVATSQTLYVKDDRFGRMMKIEILHKERVLEFRFREKEPGRAQFYSYFEKVS